jgi:hypothetical protein
MKKVFLIVAILLCCVFDARAQQQIGNDEYEVYSAWLKKGFLIPKQTEISIVNVTEDFWNDLSTLPREKRQKLSRLRSSTLENYRLRNRKPLEFKNDFVPGLIVNLISREDWLNHPARRTSDQVPEHMDNRLIFSRVGFNKKRNQALIHVHFNSNPSPKYAFGYFFVLSNDNGVWDVKQAVKSWEY